MRGWSYSSLTAGKLWRRVVEGTELLLLQLQHVSRYGTTQEVVAVGGLQAQAGRRCRRWTSTTPSQIKPPLLLSRAPAGGNK